MLDGIYRIMKASIPYLALAAIFTVSITTSGLMGLVLFWGSLISMAIVAFVPRAPTTDNLGNGHVKRIKHYALFGFSLFIMFIAVALFIGLKNSFTD